MTNAELKVHPVAALFPMLGKSELQELAEDIKANGQQQAAVRQGDVLLDGRNRLAACKLAGVAPTFEEYTGDSPVAFIISLNLKRRHLEPGQRAACAADALPEIEKEAKRRMSAGGGDKKSGVAILPPPIEDKGKAREQAAKLFGVSARYVSDAKLVKEARPELHEKVKAGHMTLPQAKREVVREEKRQELNRKAEVAKAKPKTEQTWKILHGDSVKELANIKTGTVRLVFADPPYNIGIDYGDGAKADKLTDEAYMRWCEKWLTECRVEGTGDVIAVSELRKEADDSFDALDKCIGWSTEHLHQLVGDLMRSLPAPSDEPMTDASRITSLAVVGAIELITRRIERAEAKRKSEAN